MLARYVTIDVLLAMELLDACFVRNIQRAAPKAVAAIHQPIKFIVPSTLLQAH
jgi:exoribonuclease II